MKTTKVLTILLTVFVVGLSLSQNAFAADPYLVKDIRPGSDGSGPRYFTNVNGTLFFKAYDDAHGGELWKSDGTEAGTMLVKDIRPGSEHSGLEDLK
jgi:ELWxxDGT repeat protein